MTYLSEDNRRWIAAGVAELRKPCGHCFVCAGRMVGGDVECPGEVVIDDTRLPLALLTALRTVEHQEAAIARVRAKHSESPYAPGLCCCSNPMPCPTIAALDGEAK